MLRHSKESRPFSNVVIFTNSRLATYHRHGCIIRYNENNLYFAVLCVRNHWIVLTNKDLDRPKNALTGDHWVCYESLNNPSYLFKSIHNTNEAALSLKGFFNMILPDHTSVKIRKVDNIPDQIGFDDCGFYALAIVHSLLLDEEPGCINYYQYMLRLSWNNFFRGERITFGFGNEIVGLRRR